MEAHETDYQRARRQRQEVKKHGITGATPKEAMKNIKKHEMAKKIKYSNGKSKLSKSDKKFNKDIYHE